MECPRCTGRLKRLRTKDGKAVIRYNRCLSCGERFKTIEVLLVEYEKETNGCMMEAIRAYKQAEEAHRSLETISKVFGSVRDALTPLKATYQPTDHLARMTGLPRRRSGFI